MNCPKCTGYIVQETFFESGHSYEGWRCINCGKVVVKHTHELQHDQYGQFVYQRRMSIISGTLKDD